MRLFFFAAALVLSACGPDVVSACEDAVAAQQCGDHEYSTVFDCEDYVDEPCDVTEYFICLAENTECDEASGELDTTGWTNCVQYAVCE